MALAHDQQLCTQPHVENVLSLTPTHEAVIELDPATYYCLLNSTCTQEASQSIESINNKLEQAT